MKYKTTKTYIIYGLAPPKPGANESGQYSIANTTVTDGDSP